MKTFRFTAYLFYRYYSTGPTRGIPYFSTLCALVMLLGLHVFQILVLFNRTNLLPTSANNSRGENFIAMAWWLLPAFLVMVLLIRKSDLQNMNYEVSKIKKANRFLILYIITSIGLLLFLILMRHRG
jgi:heme/copper-type cytochrome/quinol oxidase subunit 2